MTDMDYGTFAAAVTRVMAAFPRFKLQPAKVSELTRIYFDALKGHDIAAVVQAGKACRDKHKTFPAIVEWLAELPPTPACPADARHMTVAEMDAHDEAQQTRCEAEPCLCAECEKAGVMYRPLRFVPCLLPDGTYEHAYHSRLQRLEVVGHWAHGEELRAWYAARDGLFGRKLPPTIASTLTTIFGEREPGVEG